MLNLIRLRHPISRADLARVSGLQRSTISLIVEQLIDEQWVVEGSTGRLPRGRRPTFLKLNDERVIIGVDIRPAQIAVALSDANGKFTSREVIATPTDILDCFKIIPEMFNVVDKFQCPGIVLGDLLLSEGHASADPAELDFNVPIDRGEMITSNGIGTNGYKRYLFTESGVSPRAIPGVKGHAHTVATDEHMEDGVLISDEFTNPIKRRQMMEKRQRKIAGIEAAVPPPELVGPHDADVTLIGWGSTKGVIEEAVELLGDEGITANQLQIRWMVPLHGDAIIEELCGAHHTIIIENNYSGQFARYLRSETSFVADGHIRKYDGEPFMPHHIVEAVKEQLAGKTKLSVPMHEIMV